MYLIPPILFVLIDKMYLYFSVTRRYMCIFDRTKGFKRTKVVYFLQFQELSTCTVGVYIISIKYHFLLMATRNLHTKIDLKCIPLMLSLGRLEEVVHIIIVLHIAAALLPSRLVDEVIIMCILGKVYWVIAPHH